MFTFYEQFQIQITDNIFQAFNPKPYLLTYSMVQSPSWEANWFAASQDIPRISRNPKVHYRTHKGLSWASPIQSIYPHPTSWRSILILSTHLRLGFPSGLLPSGFPTKTLYTPLSSPIRTTCPAHLILLDLIPNIQIRISYIGGGQISTTLSVGNVQDIARI